MKNTAITVKNMPYIGKLVKYHRKKSGLSQIELANYSGVGKTVVYDIEKGKETVKIKTLLKILNVLNISIELSSSLMEKYKSTAEKESEIGEEK